MVNVGDPPVVAQVVRNGFVESTHRGIVVVTRSDGSVSYSRGDYDSHVLPRSSLKPIQALAMVRCGLSTGNCSRKLRISTFSSVCTASSESTNKR